MDVQLGETVEEPVRRRVAVIVLGCVLPVYDRAIAMIRRTWGATHVDGVDVYYVYGNAVGDDLADLRAYVPGPLPQVDDMKVEQVNDVIFAGCSDLTSWQSDCLLRKRLLALEHLLRSDDHDAFFLVCSSSYVDQEALLAHVQTMPADMVFQGHVFVPEDHPVAVVSGSAILLSRDLAARLVHDRDALITAGGYRYQDDVSLSSWVAEHISNESSDQIRANVAQGSPATSDNTFIGHPTGFHDFRSVGTGGSYLVPGAYHYHFFTDRMEEMAWFHREHFLQSEPSPAETQIPARAADDRIFVQIASYRDPELPLTIGSAIDNAADPSRLTFGVCWQYDEWTAQDLDQWMDDERFRIDELYYVGSRGCTWARSRIGDMYDGECYTLQIDAHMRFAPGWDVSMIEMLESIDSPRPLLTVYPPAYTRTADGGEELTLGSDVQTLEVQLLRRDLTTRQRGVTAPDHDRCGPSRFLAAGFIFTHGRFLEEVPYDGELYFAGEEISVAARAFTHGYDMRYPTENVVWHLYGHDAPLHWSDHTGHPDLEDRERARLEQLLIGDHRSLGRFGLGEVRTIGDYEQYAGVDFRAASYDLGFGERREIQVEFDLDTTSVEPRDDYEFWVFTLLDRHGHELHRADIRDPEVLSGRKRRIAIDVTSDREPTHYLLWPSSADGFGERLVLPLPDGAMADADR